MSKLKVSVILPVINETFSLEKTVEIIIQNSKDDISEIIIVTSKEQTTNDSLKLIKHLETSKYPNLIKTQFQNTIINPENIRQFLNNKRGNIPNQCTGNSYLSEFSETQLREFSTMKNSEDIRKRVVRVINKYYKI